MLNATATNKSYRQGRLKKSHKLSFILNFIDKIQAQRYLLNNPQKINNTAKAEPCSQVAYAEFALRTADFLYDESVA